MNKHWADMLRALKAHDVEFMVVGGIAVQAYGYLRTTGDVDVWIDKTEVNVDKTIRALADFFGGAGLKTFTKEKLMGKKRVFVIPSPIARIDILTGIDGITMEQAKGNSVMMKIEGVQVPVIGIKDLIKNKRASSRPQDLADIAALEKIQQKVTEGPRSQKRKISRSRKL